jgi:hypothetical protein
MLAAFQWMWHKTYAPSYFKNCALLTLGLFLLDDLVCFDIRLFCFFFFFVGIDAISATTVTTRHHISIDGFYDHVRQILLCHRRQT